MSDELYVLLTHNHLYPKSSKNDFKRGKHSDYTETDNHKPVPSSHKLTK
ncbi:MAG: hypothetical protein ACK5VR_09900 [Burkholderiales bacterium]